MTRNILLADDDPDDCTFFKEALAELPLTVNLMTVGNGVDLMKFLTDKKSVLPDALFLDLNMPRKTGLECLSEIKINDKLKNLPVFIFSTSLDMAVVDLLYDKGANYYVRKPSGFSELKNVILNALTVLDHEEARPSNKSNFILQPYLDK